MDNFQLGDLVEVNLYERSVHLYQQGKVGKTRAEPPGWSDSDNLIEKLAGNCICEIMEISSDIVPNSVGLLVPKGFGHSFQVATENLKLMIPKIKSNQFDTWYTLIKYINRKI